MSHQQLASSCRVALAALLHDLGKFALRLGVRAGQIEQARRLAPRLTRHYN